ncbi:hypothetical protein [Nonomuraea dietziae]|uniref:hypothetical protein n=1 Tax=Nonomuraea dietziae TaxID=65515 RepID=UPI0031CFA6C0
MEGNTVASPDSLRAGRRPAAALPVRPRGQATRTVPAPSPGRGPDADRAPYELDACTCGSRERTPTTPGPLDRPRLDRGASGTPDGPFPRLRSAINS